MRFVRIIAVSLLAPLAFTAGCSKKTAEPTRATTPPKHEHKPPHGGTPIVLGDELYHLELVRDADTGKLQAFILDGELENFIRSPVPSFEIDVVVDGKPRSLGLSAVANAATGETVGDTALFETQADWLKTTTRFDATLKSITIRGRTFPDVHFNFPGGNEKN